MVKSIDDSQLTTHPSLARLRANRANAKRSTGPRTPAGKARSSRNALKNGIVARAGALFDDRQPEDLALIEEVLDELRETYRPVDPDQERLLRRAALCHVRIARAMRVETFWAAELWRELRESGQREAEQRFAELDRGIAEAEQAGDHAALVRLRAERTLAKRTLEFGLENADLAGALPAPDRLVALIRYEDSARREARRIARELECMVGGRKDVWAPCLALTGGF